MTIPGRDKVDVENGQTYILGHAVKLHSRYMGWDLYRVWDGGKPRMRYIAVNVTSSSGLVTIEARNLDGIKEKVRKQRGFA